MAAAIAFWLFASGVAATAGTKLLGADSGTTTLRVTLKEFRVIPAGNQAASGKITFVARNAGETEHELVVVRARGRAKLPVKNYKAIEGNAVVGEIEDIAPGKTGRVTLKLERGSYFLICNVVGHYQLGMRTTIRVK